MVRHYRELSPISMMPLFYNFFFFKHFRLKSSTKNQPWNNNKIITLTKRTRSNTLFLSIELHHFFYANNISINFIYFNLLLSLFFSSIHLLTCHIVWKKKLHLKSKLKWKLKLTNFFFPIFRTIVFQPRQGYMFNTDRIN